MNTSSPTPTSSQTQETRAWLRSKKLWSVLVILLLLLGVGGLVPVGKIPLLRDLVYAMGYSPDEAHRISFLKALFSWNEHSKMMRGEIPDPDEVNVFGSLGGAFNSTQDLAKNKLIDIRAVNAALAKRGQKGDHLVGVYEDLAAEIDGRRNSSGQNKTVVRLTKDNPTAQTQANEAAMHGDVFFGEDASGIRRDKNDAFNSVNTLKKATKLPIAGVSKGTDWFDREVDRAIRSDVDLSEFIKKDDRTSTALAQIGAINRVGDSRAQRDMYWAWMMGRAARRTPQLLLKKTLASASFDGAELPRTVFTASGFGGVAIKADEMNADISGVQDYLDQDKNCQQALTHAGQQMNTSALADRINHLAEKFPQTCGARPGEYMSQLQSIINGCQQMKSAYESAQRVCGTLSLVLDNGQCRFEQLAAYYTVFDAYCQAKLAECDGLEGDEAQDCINAVNGLSSTNDYSECEEGCPTYNSSELDGDDGQIKGRLYTETGGLNTEYFPGVNWGRSIRVNRGALLW